MTYYVIQSVWLIDSMEKERLRTLLYNALLWIEEENSDFFANEVGNEYEWFEETIGITEEEMNELDITLSKGVEEDDDYNEENF